MSSEWRWWLEDGGPSTHHGSISQTFMDDEDADREEERMRSSRGRIGFTGKPVAAVGKHRKA